MALLPDLSHRRLEPELMDDPAIEPDRHRRALAGLRNVNRFSNSAGILWPPVAQMARAQGKRSLRVLDVASGGGDVTLSLWRRAARANVRLDVVGLERSPVAIMVARQRAQEAASHGPKSIAASIQFVEHDVLTQSLPGGFDVVTCSLFLHHLNEATAVQLLKSMAAVASDLLLVNDLHRSRSGYVLAQIGCRLLTRSTVVHFDGPGSIAGAFTVGEATALCRNAGLQLAKVERRWPSRLLWSWSPHW